MLGAVRAFQRSRVGVASGKLLLSSQCFAAFQKKTVSERENQRNKFREVNELVEQLFFPDRSLEAQRAELRRKAADSAQPSPGSDDKLNLSEREAAEILSLDSSSHSTLAAQVRSSPEQPEDLPELIRNFENSDRLLVFYLKFNRLFRGAEIALLLQ